ncbi:MAG: DUF4382 domain-containing protein [Candidatus Micrarchaeota archaeon]|nr:DUF4382 domain-containing protein [Candidatus Micrarchaeota archaeon]
MSKVWGTKKRILELLSKRKMTLTELSNSLKLSPSTVSQHIGELALKGAIERVESEFARKWKYYRLNPNFDTTALQEIPVQRAEIFSPYKKSAFIGMLVVLAAFGAVAYYMVGTASAIVPSTAQTGVALLSVSDAAPAAALVATLKSINLTVSNISVRNNGSGKWNVIANSSQTFNLLQLRNISKLLTTSNLSVGIYDTVALDIENATVTTANGTEPLLIPSNRLVIPYTFNVTSNGTSWVNLDFDLYKSLHLTGNGNVIMAPVIKASSQHNATLNVNESHIIRVIGPGKLGHYAELEMQVNGVMEQNASQTSNANLEISSDGRIYSNGTDNNSVRFVIDSGNGFTIADLVNMSYGVLNRSGIESKLSAMPNVSIAGNPGANGSIIPKALTCVQVDGVYSCNAVAYEHMLGSGNISIGIGNSSVMITGDKAEIHSLVHGVSINISDRFNVSSINTSKIIGAVSGIISSIPHANASASGNASISTVANAVSGIITHISHENASAGSNAASGLTGNAS